MNVLAYIFSDASLNNIKHSYFLGRFYNSAQSCFKVPNSGGRQPDSTTQSHWSSGSTVCFPPRGGSSSCPRDSPTLTMEPGSPVSNV